MPSELEEVEMVMDYLLEEHKRNFIGPSMQSRKII
jgi:hypothetical protein